MSEADKIAWIKLVTRTDMESHGKTLTIGDVRKVIETAKGMVLHEGRSATLRIKIGSDYLTFSLTAGVDIKREPYGPRDFIISLSPEAFQRIAAAIEQSKPAPKAAGAKSETHANTQEARRNSLEWKNGKFT